MSARPLSDEEIELLKANPDVARFAIGVATRAAEKPVYKGDGDPVEEASFYLEKSIEKQLISLGRNLAQLIDIQAKETRSDYSPNIHSSKEFFEKGKERRQTRIDELKDKVHGLKLKLTKMRDGLENPYLPLGTIVAFNGKEGYPGAYSNVDLPATGVKGVVVGLNRNGEFPVSVMIIENYMSQSGVSILVDPRSTQEIFSVDTVSLDVIDYAKLPDGSDFTGFGYFPTYMHAGSSDVEDGCMVLKVFDRYLDFVINVDEYGHSHGVVVASIDDTLWGRNWLGDPITYESENSSTMKM